MLKPARANNPMNNTDKEGTILNNRNTKKPFSDVESDLHVACKWFISESLLLLLCMTDKKLEKKGIQFVSTIFSTSLRISDILLILNFN